MRGGGHEPFGARGREAPRECGSGGMAVAAAAWRWQTRSRRVARRAWRGWSCSDAVVRGAQSLPAISFEDPCFKMRAGERLFMASRSASRIMDDDRCAELLSPRSSHFV